MYRKIEIIDTRLTGHGLEVVKCLGGRTARSMPAMTALEATTIPGHMLVVLSVTKCGSRLRVSLRWRWSSPYSMQIVQWRSVGGAPILSASAVAEIACFRSPSLCRQ